VLLLRRAGRPWLVDETYFDNRDKKFMAEFTAGERLAVVLSGAATSDWLITIVAPLTGTNYELSAYPNSPCMSDLTQFLAKVKTASANTRGAAQITIQNPNFDKYRKEYSLSGIVMLQEGTVAEKVLTWSSPDEFIFAKRVFRVSSQGIECAGNFETVVPKSVQGHERLKLGLKFLENITTVSRDGRWAASGICIYSVSSRKVVRALPILSQIHAFTPDGKGLYVSSDKGLYFLSDWESQCIGPDDMPDK
jgi:hypothetical protein